MIVDVNETELINKIQLLLIEYYRQKFDLEESHKKSEEIIKQIRYEKDNIPDTIINLGDQDDNKNI
jgi:hypothetical protein